MPVLIERRRRPRKLGVDWGLNRIDIGLVNSMPDGALESTERQYLALLGNAAEDVLIHVHLYTMPEIRRGERVAPRVKKLYRGVEALFHASLDALIVTGTEPIEADLRDEAYWPTLTQIIDWARQNTISTIFSCLAAHAAVLHLDGVPRRPLPQKLFGVFGEEVAADQQVTRGLSGLSAPHSRWNTLDEADLVAAGYSVLTRSPEAGVGIFAKARDSLFLFLQSHPEYEAETLLREYRRDIGRYLRAEQPRYPERPRHYFDANAAERVTAYEGRARTSRDSELLDDFPIFELRRAVRQSWRPDAVALYRNWLSILNRGKPTRIATRILKQAGVAIP